MVKRKSEAPATRRGALRLHTRAEEAPITTSNELANLPGDEDEDGDEEDFVEEDFDDGLDDEAIAAEHAEAEAEEDESAAAAEAERFALASGSEDHENDLAHGDDLLGGEDEKPKLARANQ